MKSFKSIGISYKTASLELRERVTFTESSAKTFMRRAQEVLGLNEMLVLSTCNRTEIYYTSEEHLRMQLCTLLDLHHGLEDPSANHFIEQNEAEAINHLYEVALGVDSMVLGDIQITNQVKLAYQWSADENMAGPFLHRLLHSIFYTNKRVVQETELRDGTASTASVAADLTKQYISAFSQPVVLILGLGEIGVTVAENLKGIEARVRVVNRTKSKAEEIASNLGYEVGGFENLTAEVLGANVIISAMSVDQPLISAATLGGRQLPKMMIDLGVPRSINDDVESKAGVTLYNIDQLAERASKTLERRQKSIPAVRDIIAESQEELLNWAQEMEVSPTIKKLKNALEEIRKEEMSRYLGNLSDKEAQILDKATKGIIQKVMKLPVLQLKAACKRGEAETLVEVLNDLFNLEKETSEKTDH